MLPDSTVVILIVTQKGRGQVNFV